MTGLVRSTGDQALCALDQRPSGLHSFRQCGVEEFKRCGFDLLSKFFVVGVVGGGVGGVEGGVGGVGGVGGGVEGGVGGAVGGGVGGVVGGGVEGAVGGVGGGVEGGVGGAVGGGVAGGRFRYITMPLGELDHKAKPARHFRFVICCATHGPLNEWDHFAALVVAQKVVKPDCNASHGHANARRLVGYLRLTVEVGNHIHETTASRFRGVFVATFEQGDWLDDFRDGLHDCSSVKFLGSNGAKVCAVMNCVDVEINNLELARKVEKVHQVAALRFLRIGSTLALQALGAGAAFDQLGTQHYQSLA